MTPKFTALNQELQRMEIDKRGGHLLQSSPGPASPKISARVVNDPSTEDYLQDSKPIGSKLSGVTDSKKVSLALLPQLMLTWCTVTQYPHASSETDSSLLRATRAVNVLG